MFTLLQAEPLVIDLKDLFQLIFNMKKKEQEVAQKVMCVYICKVCLVYSIFFFIRFVWNWEINLELYIFLCKRTADLFRYVWKLSYFENSINLVVLKELPNIECLKSNSFHKHFLLDACHWLKPLQGDGNSTLMWV